jgi:hypothetical protein
MAVLSEDKINRWIVPHLSKGKRGSKLQVAPAVYSLSSQDGLPMAGITFKRVFYQ